MSTPINEPVRAYADGSPERSSLAAELKKQRSISVNVPIRIGANAIHTDRRGLIRQPCDHGHSLGQYSCAAPEHTELAIDVALSTRPRWSRLPFPDRASIFLKAADLLSGPWRDRLNAATMLGQGKTAYQAEIDSACELADFLRFNVAYAKELLKHQPIDADGALNALEYRGLEGFVFAATPFNFTAIAGNLCIAPALMGNVVVWKPSERALLSAHYIMELFDAAGLPPGVVNMLPSDEPAAIGDVVLKHPSLAGVHFTGSTQTFQHIWRKIGDNITTYKTYPRIVGETGGKGFVFAHPSADVPALVSALLRGAFEYQGQKCSAASRAYIPSSLWNEVLCGLKASMGKLTVGSTTSFASFMSAVIDERAFTSIKGFIELAETSDEHQVLIGGACDQSKGYFIEPTVIEAKSPDTELMTREVFGPVLTLYKYEDDELDNALRACDEATPFGLTGAIFAKDRHTIRMLSDRLCDAAGNFYINDKPTGAVVGQQPFGGARASGTNDKAGSAWNLLRWTSSRTIKETLVSPTSIVDHPSIDDVPSIA